MLEYRDIEINAFLFYFFVNCLREVRNMSCNQCSYEAIEKNKQVQKCLRCDEIIYKVY